MRSIRSLGALLSVRGRVCLGVGIGVGFCVGLTACVESSAPPPKVTKPEDALVRAIASPASVILAVGETQNIALMALNVLGDTIAPSGNATIRWTTSDSLTVSVNANGVIKARKATVGDNNVLITAKWTQYGVTQSASIGAYVTATKLPIDSLRVETRDSTRTSTGLGLVPPWNWAVVVARSAQGDSVMAPLLPLTVAPSSKVTPLGVLVLTLGKTAFLLRGTGPYNIMSRHIGDYWLYTEAMVYGTMMRDSLKFTGLYPVAMTIPIARDSLANALISPYAGIELLVQPCGAVIFQNQSQTPVDVVFGDSTKAAQCVASDHVGNIANLLPGSTATRKFPAVGTIQWTVRDRNTGQLVPTASGKVSMRVP